MHEQNYGNEMKRGKWKDSHKSFRNEDRKMKLSAEKIKENYEVWPLIFNDFQSNEKES